jgi:apolipoprotein N-acyltransferase
VALGSGFVFACSTPPIDFQPGILLGLVGFAVALGPSASGEGERRRVRAAIGFCFGLAANLLALRFVPDVIVRFTPLPMVAGWLALVLLSAAQALPWTVAGALASWLAFPAPGSSRAPMPRWLAFATAVYAATFVPALFPWTPAGGLARWPILLQSAELVGERGTSFLVAIACGLAAEALRRAPAWRAAARPAVLAAGVLALLVTYGALRERSIDAARAAAAHARVGLIEPDFDPVFHFDRQRANAMMDTLSDRTRQAEREGAELTIWPESSYPYTLPHGIGFAPPRGTDRAILQPGVRGPVLTGVYMSTETRGLGTNSAILVSPDGTIGPSYDKRHLLWFGETVPLADVFPALRRVFARGTGLVPGRESSRFESGPIAFAVLNCYEDTLPVAGREAMEVRPNLLVNVTNDTWFSGSAESELHLRLAVLRAIETRRDLLRAVNRGPTTWVDAAGRVLARREAAAGSGAPPPLVVDAALLDSPPTLYARAGDAPLVLLLFGGLLSALLVARRRAGS